MTDRREEERARAGPEGDGSATGGRGLRAPMAHPVEPPAQRSPSDAAEPRPVIERLGMAAVAVVLGCLFAGVAVAAYVGGELFLAVMAAIGSLMTFWVGALTLVRG